MESETNLSEAQSDPHGINPSGCPNVNGVLVDQQSSEKSQVAESSRFLIDGNITSIPRSASASTKANGDTTAAASDTLPEIKHEYEPTEISSAANVTQGPNVNFAAIEDTGPENVSAKAIVLPTRIKQMRLIILFDIFCIIGSTFVFYYVLQTLTVRQPRLGALLFSPTKTVALVNAMSTILLVLITALCHMAFELLKWQVASREKGVAMTTFLGLSMATTLFGVLRLMFVWGAHLFWCVMR